MELQFSEPRRVPVSVRLRPVLLFCALWCAVSGLLDLFSPFAFLGLLPLTLFAFLPKRAKYWWLLAAAVLLAGFLALRFSEILHGLKLLADRLFTLSEERQSYEYNHFSVPQSTAALREGIAFLSAVTALIFCFHGGLALAGVFLAAQTYFGVTAPAGWLLLLLFTAVLSVLPQERLLFYAPLTAVLIGLAALVVFTAAPEPSVRISGWDEQARDHLALQSIFYERTPERVEIPQEQMPPQPERETPPEQTASDVSSVNVLFIALLLLTLLLLFVPAAVRDRARKKRERNRAGIDDADPAAAIRAMYLHSRRWLRLKPEPVPEEIAALWLLAAYSEHPLTDGQRQQMAQYLTQVEQRVWQSATRRERLRIRYRLCL